MSLAGYSAHVIKNPIGRFYIGLTDNVLRRVEDHNSGVSTWTRGKGPWSLVFERNCMTLSQARRLEGELKRQKGGDGFYLMTGLKREHSS
jgi:predicted GIY-YIG superfamily endonuclease